MNFRHLPLTRIAAAALAGAVTAVTIIGAAAPAAAADTTVVPAPSVPGTRIALIKGATPADVAGNVTMDLGHHEFLDATETADEHTLAVEMLAQWNTERRAAGVPGPDLVLSSNLSGELQAWLFQKRAGGTDLTHPVAPKGDGSLPPHRSGAFQSEAVSTGSVFDVAENATAGFGDSATGDWTDAWSMDAAHRAAMVKAGTVAGVAVACKADGSMNAMISVGWRTVDEAIAGKAEWRQSGWVDPSPTAPITKHVGKGGRCVKQSTTPPPTGGAGVTPPPATTGIGSALNSAFPTSRLVDTRTTGQRLAAGGVLRVDAAAGAASAVVIQLTAVPAGAAGFLTAFPCGTQVPTASNVNFTAATPSSSLATVQLAADGTLCVFSNAAADVVVDRLAVWSPAPTTGAAAGRFQAVAPTRIVDTRNQGGQFARGETRTFTTGAPAGASAVMINLTATNTAGGWLAAFNGEWAGTSNLNVAAGETRANAAIVPVDADGTINVTSSNTADVIIDVTGWFTGTDAPVATAGLFVPTAPTRVLDTRDGGIALAAGATKTVPTGTGAGAVAVAATVTAIGTTDGFITVWPAGTNMPLASTINAKTTTPVPNLVLGGITAGQFSAFTQTGTHLVVDINGWFQA